MIQPFSKETSVPLLLAKICGILSWFLGLSVLFGWYTHNLTLIQVTTSFVPMQFNTALGFMLSGFGLLLVILGKRNVGIACGIIVMLIGLLTLAEYIFGVEFGIDQFLMKHYVTVQTSHPGRMAPNTALCFSLAGAALVVLGHIPITWKSSMIIGVLGSLIFSLCFVALAGYMFSLETAYGWGKLTRMAVHSAVGFIFLSVSIFSLAWHRSNIGSSWLPSWFPAPIGIGVMTIMISLWQALNTFENKLIKEYSYPRELHLVSIMLLVVGVVLAIALSAAFYHAQTARKKMREVNDMNKMLAIEITERQQVEEKLRISEGKYRAIFETSQVGIALCKMDGTLVEVNQGFLDIIGYNKEDTLKLTNWKITPRKYEAKEAEQLDSILQTGRYGPYEKEYIHKDGNYVPVVLTGSVVKGGDGTEYIWSLVHNITQLKQADEMLAYQASHDNLTGLINRHEFERRCMRLLSTVKQNNEEHALCFMDLDQFKVVNDTCGHAAGDEMLRQLSSVLQDIVRKRDTLARLGGDEFGVLMEYCSLDDAYRVATSLQKAIQDFQLLWEEHHFKVGVSIGLASITKTTTSLTDLLKDADAACYMAKDKGRNRIHVYCPEDVEMARRHGEMQWVERLNKALEEDRFCLYAQAIQPLDGSKGKHYELLVRMINEKGEMIPPEVFLPAAERYNLIGKIDRWVIENAFRLLAKHSAFLKHIDFCSINLSGQSLTDSDILSFLINQLNEAEIGKGKICFEITETAAISNLSLAKKFILTLKDFGCLFALDDFGSGLSSFAYLKNLPVNYLKIDGVFVKDIVDDPIDHSMVKSINDIGHVMGMKTIAEFVENEFIKGMLKEIGVDYAQGYGISKPLPFDKLLARLSNVTEIKIPKYMKKIGRVLSN